MMVGFSKEIFFSESASKKLCCVYHYPEGRRIDHQILFVHSFGDEMNKSRRMVTLQSEAFAREGIAVLSIDLFGCGDSEGEFREAAWSDWIDNVHHGMKWLDQNANTPVSLWGLRLGCLLISDFLDRTKSHVETVIFWQPILDGRLLIRQLKRQKMASGLLKGDGKYDFDKILQKNKMIEISGYEINESLIRSIEKIQMVSFPELSCNTLVWKELSLTGMNTLPSASKRVLDKIQSADFPPEVDFEGIDGKSFWGTVEIETNSSLLDRTLVSFLQNRKPLDYA